MGKMELVSHKHKKPFENHRTITKIGKNNANLVEIDFSKLLDGTVL